MTEQGTEPASSRSPSGPFPGRLPGRPLGPMKGRLALAVWLAYMVAVLFLALGPVTVDTGLPHGDKILHGLAFAGMVLLYPWPLAWNRLWLMALMVVVLAGGIEIIQDYTPAYGRRPDLYDFFAGVAGGVVGMAVRLALGSPSSSYQ